MEVSPAFHPDRTGMCGQAGTPIGMELSLSPAASKRNGSGFASHIHALRSAPWCLQAAVPIARPMLASRQTGGLPQRQQKQTGQGFLAMNESISGRTSLQGRPVMSVPCGNSQRTERVLGVVKWAYRNH